jgi:ATP-dependent helicase/nuclease subunit A
MTVHASKGLEFDVTILPDLTAGLQPDRSPLRLVPGVGLALKLEDQEEPAAWKTVGERNKERDLAESKRLLYVAITRAKEECVFLLPRTAEAGKKGRGESWAEMIRASGLAEGAARRGGETLGEAAPAGAAEAEHPREGAPLPAVLEGRRLEASITELAAYQYCPEFHRRKFVQQWDDRVVSLWKVDPQLLRRRRGGTRGEDAGKDYVARLLRRLRIENKERGIALHRVLERLRSPELDPAVARLWLREAYDAQGADVELPEYHELAEKDLELLGRFLASPLGQEIFAADVEAFPELPFFWKFHGAYLQGAMDRVIRKPDGSWVVVDYKSSVLDESLEKYRFQVQSYLAAVAEYAPAREGGAPGRGAQALPGGPGEPGRGAQALPGGPGAPRVTGYLVDLYQCTSHNVSDDPARAAENLAAKVGEVRESYTLAAQRERLFGRGLEGGEHCLHCTYRFHCEIGKEIVLRFP